MTTLQTPELTASETVDHEAAAAAPAPGLVGILGGLALGVAPVLMSVGFFTSPPQDSTSNVDYVTSMARAPFQAALSADFLHYAWVVWALAALSMITLLHGRRGRVAGTVTALLAAISSIQLSGLLLSDFYAVRVTQESGAAAAAAVEFDLGTSVDIWLWSAKPAALLVPALFFFLAYSRAISWWLAPLPLLSGLLIAAPLPAPVNIALMIIMWAPAYLAARQLITGRRRVA
jgi:hypothetical protein